MEDLRELMDEREAVTPPENLGYVLHGLVAAVHDLIEEGAPESGPERIRYLSMLHSVSHCAELHAAVLARWLGRHRDECPLLDE